MSVSNLDCIDCRISGLKETALHSTARLHQRMKKPIPGLLFSDASYIFGQMLYFVLTAPMLLARHFMCAFTIPWLLSSILLLMPYISGFVSKIRYKFISKFISKNSSNPASILRWSVEVFLTYRQWHRKCMVKGIHTLRKTGRKRVIFGGGELDGELSGRDRYLYLPDRLLRALKEEKKQSESAQSSSKTRQKYIFASKVAFKNYIKTYFPGTDPEAVFSTFYWKIPALPPVNEVAIPAIPLRQIPPQALPAPAIPLLQIAHEAYNSNGDNAIMEAIIMSRRQVANELLARIDTALYCGTNLEDISKEDDSVMAQSVDNGNDKMENTSGNVEAHDPQPPWLTVEVEVNQVIENFNSHGRECRVIVEKLQSQKRHIQKLYEQLDYEKNVLVGDNSASSSKVSRILEIEAQIKREWDRFHQTKKLANDFKDKKARTILTSASANDK
ncbi:unnamed protein product [Sphenostylis stenocarpa]|uniref:Uncharacterized protein n=1 Tax=Sphenostylis stenocarpa TaxID=92480 RepID=A0AA86VWF7_9FABA|nr:unnamed protein product [Sphenostylis stenocarpa]